MNNATHTSHPAKYEVITAVVLAVLAIGSFVLQAYLLDAKTTQRETTLFNTLQFLLTIGFAWFSTRAVSRLEFERNLKQFAIGAYRRITDIEAMVERLRQQLAEMRQKVGDSPSSYQFDVVGAVLEDTIQVVRSSTADWADVIGEELLALDTIRTLRREKTELQTGSKVDEVSRSLDERLREIDKRIEALTSNLPPNLQIETRREEDDEQMQRHHVEWMRWRHDEEGGVRLRVVAGGVYKCDGDVNTLNSERELFAVLDHKPGIVVEDAAGVHWGRILNNSPLEYETFRQTLQDCFGSTRVPIAFVSQAGQRTKDGETLSWYNVKIAAEPTIEDKDLHVGLRRRARARHVTNRGANKGD